MNPGWRVCFSSPSISRGALVGSGRASGRPRGSGGTVGVAESRASDALAPPPRALAPPCARFRLTASQLRAALTTTLARTTPVSVSPVSVSNLVTGPQSHVRLTNTASQPVTAWSLAITTSTGANRTHGEVETVDGYLSEVTRGLPGSSERL